VARLGYRLATFKIPEPRAKARTKPSAYIPRPEGRGFTPTSVNQRLRWVRLRQRVLGFVKLHLEANILVAAGCGRGDRRGLGRCGCCKKQKYTMNFMVFLNSGAQFRRSIQALCWLQLAIPILSVATRRLTRPSFAGGGCGARGPLYRWSIAPQEEDVDGLPSKWA